MFSEEALQEPVYEEISEKEIEKAKLWIVEDPSGWSQSEVRRRNSQPMRELYELREAFQHDEGKLQRYQKLCGEHVNGKVTAAVFHDCSMNGRAIS